MLNAGNWTKGEINSFIQTASLLTLMSYVIVVLYTASGYIYLKKVGEKTCLKGSPLAV